MHRPGVTTRGKQLSSCMKLHNCFCLPNTFLLLQARLEAQLLLLPQAGQLLGRHNLLYLARQQQLMALHGGDSAAGDGTD